jgi:O-antigen ligase
MSSNATAWVVVVVAVVVMVVLMAVVVMVVGVVVVVVVVVVAVAVAVVGQQRCDMVCRGARRPVMHTWYKDRENTAEAVPKRWVRRC